MRISFSTYSVLFTNGEDDFKIHCSYHFYVCTFMGLVSVLSWTSFALLYLSQLAN